jgi:hypothetical protein
VGLTAGGFPTLYQSIPCLSMTENRRTHHSFTQLHSLKTILASANPEPMHLRISVVLPHRFPRRLFKSSGVFLIRSSQSTNYVSVLCILFFARRIAPPGGFDRNSRNLDQRLRERHRRGAMESCSWRYLPFSEELWEAGRVFPFVVSSETREA